MQVVATKINIDQLPSSWGEFSRARAQSWYRKKKFRSPRNNFWAQGWKSPGAKHGLGPKELFVPRYFAPKPARIFAKKLRIIIFFRVRSKAHCFLLSCFLTGFEPSTSWARCLSLPFVLKLKKAFCWLRLFLWKSLKITFLTFFLQKLNKPFFAKSHFRSEKNRKERH